jgi:hypothetical protein
VVNTGASDSDFLNQNVAPEYSPAGAVWHPRVGPGYAAGCRRSFDSASEVGSAACLSCTGYGFPFGSRTGVNCTEAIRHLSACRTNTAVVPMDVVRLGVSYVSVIRPVSIAVSP